MCGNHPGKCRLLGVPDMSSRHLSRRSLLAYAGAVAALLTPTSAWARQAMSASDGMATRIAGRPDLTSESQVFLAALKDAYRAAPHPPLSRSDLPLDPKLHDACRAMIATGNAFFERPGRCHDDVLLKYGMLEEILMRATHLNGVVDVDAMLLPWWQQIDRDRRRYRVDINRWWDQRLPVSPFPRINGQRTDWHDGAWYVDGRLYRRLV